jgi:CDP-diacylglycerol--serine O-phosphatidyltransferase
MREHLTPANLVTSAGLAAGFAALLVSQEQVRLAVGLISGAAVLDGLDGVLARRSGKDRAFGGQLDSLTDVVCFGVVPAATLWWAVLDRVPVLGAFACGSFLVAGAWRLARFHLVQRPDRFVGLPIPLAGLLLMLVALWGPPPGAAALGCLLLGSLMVSTLPIPTLQGLMGALPTGARPHGVRSLHRRRRPARLGQRRPRMRRPVGRQSVLRRLNRRRRAVPRASQD